MHPNSRIIQAVGWIDAILAICLSCYIGFLLRKGKDIIPGEQLSDTEKMTRLVVYVALLYMFLFLQLYKAVELLKATKLIIEEPMKSSRKITDWLEWSFVYLLFIALHGATALLLMKPSQRKTAILTLSSIQVIFRIIAILVTTKYQFLLPQPGLPSKV